MQVIDKKIAYEELKKISVKGYGWFVKVVVDIKREIMVVDAELHADGQALLLENGSEQHDLWGINIHPKKFGTKNFIEFDSMINFRPSWGNNTRSVESLEIAKKITDIVSKLVMP